MKIAAFFDLDGTLIRKNSVGLWIQREWRLGRINRTQLVQAVFYFIGYKIGMIDMDKATTIALQSIKGLEEETLRSRIHEWYQKEVVPHTSQGAFVTIKEHLARGHQLVLITSTSRYESEAAKAHFALDDFLCTDYEVKEGRFTGNLVSPMCYGQGKVFHAEKYARINSVDLERSFFYSDSITDLPLLKRVGNPRAVSPDFRLAFEARLRAWPILDWH